MQSLPRLQSESYILFIYSYFIQFCTNLIDSIEVCCKKAC
jgi:hypothetical protein